ncbi:unnamed protein product [Orchesella dallaii]|uniref:PRELI/MSF1 domain-containing protein n=1 Tax=Orchesella dallaii TaxID=48710 RepID=A0ABP1Q4X0_9HEXA
MGSLSKKEERVGAKSTHVLSEDTLFRTLLQGHELYSRRLLTKANKLRLPKWADKLGRTAANIVIVEESLINPVNKTITTYTRNIGYSSKLISIVEKVVYRPADGKEFATKVVAEREAWIESTVYGLRRAIEAGGVERFRKQCGRAVMGFNYVLANMYPEVGKGVGGGGATREALSGAKHRIKEKARLAKEMAKERARRLSNVYAEADASKKKTED